MKPLQWIAFGLTILFAAFYGLFAFSALPELTAFGIMLVPTVLVLGAMLWGLHRPLHGAIAFFALGVIAFFFYASYKSIVQFLLVDFPFFVLAGLLLWHYLKER